MPTILVLFNLKPGASKSDYETWAREKDLPTVNGLPSVATFRVLQLKHLLGSDAPAGYQYCELIEVPDMEAFMADIQTPAVQEGAKTFGQFADNPQFIVCEDL